MSLVAVITRAPRLRLDEWVECIRSMSELVPVPPRDIVNPFTGAAATVHAAPGHVNLWVGGETVGAVEPGPEFAEDGELHVFAAESRSEEALRIAAAIARALGADLEWID